MSFPKIKATTKGREMVARALAGEQLQFTHFAIGNGIVNDQEDWVGLSTLVGPIMDVEIVEYSHDGNVARLTGEFTNAEIADEFWWREIGIFASISGDEEEVLCFYGNAGDLTEYIPTAVEESIVTHRWNTLISISSDADVSALVSSVTYATSEQLADHANNKKNPHNVTADQVGLGNVPNVATDDQTPSFTKAKTLSELVTKEKLSTAFGKIAKAISSLIAHLKNEENPHKVTAKQADAAPTSHRSQGTTYGMGTSLYFGHVRLTDDTEVETGAGDGIAVTPKAMKAAISKALEGYTGSGDAGDGGTASIDEDAARELFNQLMDEAETSGTFKGDPGEDGEDGVSPRVALNETDDGVNVTIVDAEGIHTATLKNGKDGADGAPGEAGISPVISLTETAEGVNITVEDSMGIRIATVKNGKDGADGSDGAPGTNGADGKDGENGVDGVSPTAVVTETTDGATITLTDVNGITTANIKNGETGPQGETGPAGPQGPQGVAGSTPQKGVDYMTDSEMQSIKEELMDKIPVTVAADGYSDFYGLRRPVSMSLVKTDQIITLTTTLQGDQLTSTIITLDENGYPIQITSGGVACEITWEGFVEEAAEGETV